MVALVDALIPPDTSGKISTDEEEELRKFIEAFILIDPSIYLERESAQIYQSRNTNVYRFLQ